MNSVQDFQNVFDTITPWAGRLAPGFDVDFLGTLTDISFRLRPGWHGERASSAGGDVATFLPRLDNTAPSESWLIAEWNGERWFEAVNWFVAAREARTRFVMVTLGAWHGSQAVGSYRAVQRINPMPCMLVAVEPMKSSYQLIARHFRTNGIDPGDHWLIPMAVNGTNEPVFFAQGGRGMGPQNCFSTNHLTVREGYFERLVESGRTEQALRDLLLQNRSGLHVRQPDISTGEPLEAEIELVSAITLGDVLGPFERVDYLESDIQQSELVVFPPFMELLKKKVRRIHIGTHGKEAHEMLHDLFARDSWEIVFSFEPDGVHQTALGTFTNRDGVLTVRNPTL
jgi:hypothetical protein